MTACTPTHPKLRFPEFDAAPEWKQRSLGEVCEMKAGDFVPASEIVDVQKDGLFPCYGGNGRRGFVKTYTHSGLYVLVGRQGALCGNVNLVEGCFHATEHALVATPSFGIDTRWLYYALDILKLNRFATGLAQPGLSVTILNAVPIAVPTNRDEQEKIADCLGSLDDLIAGEGQKLEALRQHKQGLMQQLFPSEGETVPRLRFPEFKSAPEWDEQELRSVCDRIMDGTHFSPKSKSGPRPYLTSKNIRNGWMDLSTVSYISEEEHREIFARCPVQQFDVLLTKDGANTGTCAINLLGYEFSLLSSVAVLRGDVSRLTQGFLFQSLVSERMQSTIKESMSGQAITRITLETLGSYKIVLPSIPEQQRIAECLSLIDTCIAAQSQKVRFLCQHKQGLLQQLFPSLEGETR